MALDPKGEALSSLLPEALGEFDVEVGAAVDEVVVAVNPDDLLAICRLL